MFDLGVTLLEEIRCLSLLGVKGLNNQIINNQIIIKLEQLYLS